MRGDDANFPIDVKSPLVAFLQQVILWGIKVLAVLMVSVILWSIGNVVYTLISESQNPLVFIADIDALLGVFGSFLVVLIGIEIFLNIILYLEKDMSHLRLVITTALMAIARKVIILDYDKISDWQLIGMGVLIVSLGLAYWFICQVPKSHLNLPSNRNPS